MTNRLGSDYSKLIIIGAARSGTNMLRDIITSLNGVSTWPCDEIPYIWRYGNSEHPHDEFTRAMATPKVKNYIRKSFDKMAFLTAPSVLVEKTCASTLRVAYINEIFPEAKFIYLYRNGADAVASTMKRWVAPFEFKYSLQKAPFVPLRDYPYYGSRFALNRIKQKFTKDKRLGLWGPAFEGIQDVVKKEPLHVVCGHQWQRCVDVAERDFNDICSSQVFKLRYEDFVESPQRHLKEILSFIDLQFADSTVNEVVKTVRKTSVGKS